VRFGKVTLVSSLVTFAVFFVINEAWFYASHRALHSPRLWKYDCGDPEVEQVDHPLTTWMQLLTCRKLALQATYALRICPSPGRI